MKDQFIQRLRDTHREGMEKVIDALEKIKFFEAPASVQRHLSQPEGLLRHSLSVCDTALALRETVIAMNPNLEKDLKKESIVIAALLHDICKADIYVSKQKWRKDEHDRWESYEGYDTDYSRFPVGHGEKSVIMLLQLGLKLEKPEVLAIRWHMGGFDLPFQSYDIKQNLSMANNKFPLVSLIQAADMLSTFLMEPKGDK